MIEITPIVRCANCPKFLLDNRGWLNRLLHGSQPIDTNCKGTVDLVDYETIQAFGRFIGRIETIKTICPKDVAIDVIATNQEQVTIMDKLYRDMEDKMREGEYDSFTGGWDSFRVRSVNTVE